MREEFVENINKHLHKTTNKNMQPLYSDFLGKTLLGKNPTPKKSQCISQQLTKVTFTFKIFVI
jgi:hypothetical protein